MDFVQVSNMVFTHSMTGMLLKCWRMFLGGKESTWILPKSSSLKSYISNSLPLQKEFDSVCQLKYHLQMYVCVMFLFSHLKTFALVGLTCSDLLAPEKDSAVAERERSSRSLASSKSLGWSFPRKLDALPASPPQCTRWPDLRLTTMEVHWETM